MYMRIPLETSAESVEDANEARCKVFRFIHCVKHIEQNITNSVEETV